MIRLILMAMQTSIGSTETVRPSGTDPTPTKGSQTRRAILDAAIVRFGREGFRSTAVADIARDASVGGTVAYAYFPNKQALFLAALDEDAAAVINEGLSSVFDDPDSRLWRRTLLFTLVEALDRHPLARRVLAGLEPDVTDRVLELPAITDLRTAVAERLRADQAAGTVRPDIDPDSIGTGAVAIIMSILMSVMQFGPAAVLHYGREVLAVFEAALDPLPPSPSDAE
jgi:AcrR family transcriptional regulator